MGFLTRDQFLSLWHTEGELRFAPAAARIPVSLTRIAPAPDVDGGFVIDNEVPVEWRIAPRSEAAGFRDPPTMRNVGWIRLEWKLSREHLRDGERLHVSQTPITRRWVAGAPFKPGNKWGAASRPDPLKHRFESEKAAVAWFESHGHDFWETGSRLTAGLSVLDPPWVIDGRIRNDFEAFSLGIGPAEELVSDQLRRSGKVRMLLEATERNRIRFWHPNASSTTGKEPFLRPEVIDRREELMEISLRQALAGPTSETVAYVGCPAVDLVDDIYCKHLNNLNRAH